MKTRPSSIFFVITLFFLLFKISAFAGTDVWTGSGGANNLFWLSTVNWNPAGIPQSGDTLVFTNTVGLINSNNISGGNFNNITFATPSGAFALNGNSVTLANITDLQAVTPEAINLPIIDNSPANLNLNVTASGVLNLNNIISGIGNLTNSGAGRLNLTATNTFTGSLVINGGIVTVNQESNLPVAPITPTPGNIIINGGTLQALAGFTLNSNRGMAIGPTSGSGQGAISVNTEATTPNQYATLIYGGAITNNGGGTGGLTKLGFGNLVLFGTNTYTGTTSNEVGTLTLDFSKPGAPANNIISSSSRLVFGGSISGAGVTNFAQLIMTNSAAGTVSQTFNGTHVTVGSAIIRVASGSGTANLTLGALDHDVGGVLALMPPKLKGGAGNILTTPTTTNLNGIIGGWATISDGNTVVGGWPTSTNWACVDGSGNITNYNNFTIYSSGFLSNILAYSNNILIPSTATGTLTVAPDNTNGTFGIWATYDVNAIAIDRSDTGWTFQIGVSNILRLGTSGGILRRTYGASTSLNFGTAGTGQVTAGGPNIDTPGEIVLTTYQTDNANNNLALISPIVDNGVGAVAVVKAGSGFASLNGVNSYSGGTYIEGGRLRWNGGNYGTGPIYIFPGGYTYVNGGTTITNAWFISGNGAQQEAGIGAIRYGPGPDSGSYFTGPITLIGDSEIGGQGAGAIVGPISGPFKLTLGASTTVSGDTCLVNTNNSWSGDTLITARNNAGVNSLTLSNSEVIPNGFGKGNVTMQGFGTGQIQWNLNGFNETINGLSTAGTSASCVISNGAALTTSTLTLGDNDQSGTFAGILKAGNGILALTKIGGGVETLTAADTYTGATTISNGVLQLTGSGAIASSTNVNIYGGTFDVSALSYNVPATQPINIAGGTWFISSANSASSVVNITNGTLKVLGALNTATPNLTASTINVSGSANVIQPVNIPPISAFPTAYPIVGYTTLNGSVSTFSASLPAGGFPPYGGFISNDTVNKQIDLVMTNGPVTPSLTWRGYSGGSVNSTWDFVVNDWTNKPAHTFASYSDGSLVIFDDSASNSVVNLTTTFTPAGVTVSNALLNYNFTGIGAIVGTNGVTKNGPAKLTLDETGGDSYNGLSISAGTVQIGINDAGGSLGTNAVGNNGTLVFNRNNSVLNIPNTISGSGSILLSNVPGTTTILSGGSSFTGDMYVKTNLTLDVANANALSSTNGTLTIATNSTLDVSGQGIGANSVAVKKVVSVSGAGVDGTSGAIVNNTTTNQQNALLRVALTGDTTFGGTGRFDIRGTPAQHGALSTGGNAYNLTKKGTFFLSLANVDVDAALNNVDVQGGTLELNGTTTGPGTGGTLTIENSAALQLFSMSNAVSKTIVFGNSLLTNANGNNAITGPMTLNAGLIVGGGTNTTLTLGSAIGGGGSLTKNTVNTLVLTGNNTYAGTTVNDGTLIINGINSGGTLTGGADSVSPVPTIVGGSGTNNTPTDIEDTLWPGVIGHPATLSVGNGSDYDQQGSLIFNDTGNNTPKAEFSLNTSTTVGSGINDLVVVTGDFNGNGSSVRINPLTPLTAGNSYTILTYSGTLVVPTFNAAAVVDAYQPSRYLFSLDHSTAHVIKLNVTQSAGNLVWNNNAANGLWDTNTSANWFNTGTSASDVFLQLDNVTFDDSIGGSSQAVNVAVTNLVPGSVTVNNSAVSYTLFGNGSIGGSTLLKQGNGTLTISNANTFTGTVTVKGGTLAANGNGSLGSGTLTVYGGTVQANAANLSLVSTLITNGTVLVNNTNGLGGVSAPIYITNSGTLDIGGTNLTANQIPLLGSEPIYISGWGVNSNGCLINSSTNNTQEDAFQNITMTGDAAIGGVGIINGPGRFDIGRLTNNPTFSTGGNPYNLYKVGSNQVSFITVMVDTNLGNIDIKGGELGFEQGTTSMGNPLSNAIVEVGASLEFFASSGTNNFTKQFIINGDGVTTNIIQASGNVTLNGDMALNNIVGIGGAGTTLSNNALMHGTGGVIKSGGLNLILTTNETYTGNTTISAGTISLLGNGSINTSPNITVLAGATLNVAGRANNTLTLASGQTLRGNGTINGTLTNLVGTILLTGTNGVLTVTTNASFGGSALIANQLDHGSNTVMVVSGSVTYGGTLTVTTNAASTTTLTAGTTYQLFNATTYAGTFSTINLPALDPSLTWDTSQLGNNGTIQVVSAGGSPFTQTPTVTSLSLNGSNVSISGTNGQAGDVYYLLQSTNVALPLSQWTVIATNVISSVGANGSFSFSGTNVIVPADQQQFYILSNTNSNH